MFLFHDRYLSSPLCQFQGVYAVRIRTRWMRVPSSLWRDQVWCRQVPALPRSPMYHWWRYGRCGLQVSWLFFDIAIKLYACVLGKTTRRSVWRRYWHSNCAFYLLKIIIPLKQMKCIIDVVPLILLILQNIIVFRIIHFENRWWTFM